MKPLSVKKLRAAVRDMRPGFLLVRKADNQIMACHAEPLDFSKIDEIIGLDPVYMIIWKKVKE